jgi:hypothetical protein
MFDKTNVPSLTGLRKNPGIAELAGESACPTLAPHYVSNVLSSNVGQAISPANTNLDRPLQREQVCIHQRDACI